MHQTGPRGVGPANHTGESHVGFPAKGYARLIPPDEPTPRMMAGSTVCYTVAPGRPVPWKVPHVGKFGCKPTKGRHDMAAWQQVVAARARLAMAGRKPYSGPVRLSVTFNLVRRPGRQSNPDLTNLVKALEDAIQDVVIVNDQQVSEHVKMRRVWVDSREDEGAVILVEAL